MAFHNDVGKEGEKAATAFLQQHGYTILHKNWVFQKAEIDILAQKGNLLIAIEVKTRSSTEFGLPQDFVNTKKINLLVKAVNEYVQQNDLDVEVRFDIIAVYRNDGRFSIEHLEDAFYYF